MIPFVDLKTQYGSIKDEINEAVMRTLDSGQFVLGSEVAAFEKEFAAFCGTGHAVAVNSGTSALHLALLAAGIGPGDEVITVSFTFVATTAAILYTGATPVFVDVDPLSYTMDASRIEERITGRTKAILPVHIHGQPADMDAIVAIAGRHGLIVIEDAAQAHGAEYKGRRAGGIGDMGCFSFYPSKNLGACGEGGLVTTGNPDHLRTLRMLRDWGQEKKYHHVMKGYNYRMEGIQGAVLRVKLRHLDAWTEARRAYAAMYDLALAGAVALPRVMPGARHVYHVYSIRTPQRNALQEKLAARGIATNIHYPVPVHLQPAYADRGYKAGDFPVAEQIAREVISLPLYPEMPREHVEIVARAVRECLQS